MSPHVRRAALIGVLGVMLAVTAAWNAQYMLGKHDAARRAAEDLAACRRLAKDIRALRTEPKVASIEAMGVQELGACVEAASRRAGFAPDALQGIFPQAPRRVGASPYLQKPTALSLQNVTLVQLGTFLHHLTAETGLSVQDVRLRIPHGAEEGRTWNVETTVLSLIYAPAEPANRGE